MVRTCKQILEHRRQLKREYGRLFETVTAILFRADPVGINFEVNPDEYETEAGTILPRLKECNSVEDVQKVVYEEFVRWFGAGTAGPHAGFRKVATKIWEVWQKRTEVSTDPEP